MASIDTSDRLSIWQLAPSKQVMIQIDGNDLAQLKSSGYKLCFAKKVNDAYNVVWQSSSAYLPANKFSWTMQYQLSASNMFFVGMQVTASTNSVKIGLGETSVLEPFGLFNPPHADGLISSITMRNNYGPIHPVVSQFVTGVSGESESLPIYIAERGVDLGEARLTPVQKVLVWFEKNIETSTVFNTARSLSVEIDLTDLNSATCLYKDGQWTVTPQSALHVETKSAEEVVQSQLDAYNARNIDAFLATYANEVELFGFPNTPLTKGKEAMRKRYTARFSDTILHCTIVKRIVMGNTVIDHERVRVTLPEGAGVMEAIAIYEVHDGKIAKVTFISGKKTPGEKL
ncbi:nuclear transport factor 2 family protein [Collimonas sp. NPDC087041]|uniref:nuclear transport factor 2 family protein n=1 Tax=Collimonas sp. NPDC087041 TaxID=3363960 RepID=UPI0038279729